MKCKIRTSGQTSQVLFIVARALAQLQETHTHAQFHRAILICALLMELAAQRGYTAPFKS